MNEFGIWVLFITGIVGFYLVIDLIEARAALKKLEGKL